MPPGSDQAAPADRVLRILHLEDDPADRELVRQTLAAVWRGCQISHAADGAGFHATLGQADFDLILSDYTLPHYDGTDALAYARTTCPGTPFLIFSGTIGEERAVDSLKNGATDCVSKQHLERLVPAVRRALGEAAARAERAAAEQALRRSEERFREMAETIRDAFWSTSPDSRQLWYVSPAFEQIWGRSVADLLAHPSLWLEAIEPGDREGVEAALAQLATGTEYRMEYRIRRPDGTMRWVEDRGFPVRGPDGRIERAVGVATDITARRQLEAKLQQAQKMEAIGQLAGGIAHDFNNNLTVIIGNATLLLDGNDLTPEKHAHLRNIYTAGERAAHLTRQLMVFSRKQAIQIRPIDLNEVVSEAATLLARLIGEQIRLELVSDPSLPLVEADPSMVEQVLMNLAVNARDAMPRGGRLVLRTSTVLLTPADLPGQSDGRPGRFVCLSVTDSGSGIPPEVLPHIFEPFFTTKPFGLGTGMGLATVFGIVTQHQGWLTVESSANAGTKFKVFLPAAPSGTVATSLVPAENAIEGGHETILLVEDEDPVREFTCAVLQKLGYRVLQASSSVQALDAWKWHAPRIALLLTDIVMPDDLSGIELAEKLRSEKPSLKVLCASGYSHEMMARLSAPPPGTRFINKPYHLRSLAHAVRTALDSGPASDPATPGTAQEQLPKS